MSFKSLNALVALPLIQDIGDLASSWRRSRFFFSMTSKTTSLILSPFFWIASRLGRFLPGALSSRIKSFKDWARAWILQLDTIGELIVQKASEDLPFLNERLSVVLGMVRDAGADTLIAWKNRLGTHTLGRWGLNAAETVLKIFERPFVPFSGVMIIPDSNNNVSLPKDLNALEDSIKKPSSILTRFLNFISLGLLGKVSSMREFTLESIRGVRKSIIQTIRLGELKASQMEEEFLSSGGISSHLGPLGPHGPMHFVFDGLKEILIYFHLSSDVPSFGGGSIVPKKKERRFSSPKKDINTDKDGVELKELPTAILSKVPEEVVAEKPKLA